MKILIAEDEEISRNMLQAALEEWGHDVEVACDGQEAWEAMQGSNAPQLAVLDWMMPEIEGPALCRALRKQDRAEPLYLILLTSKADGMDVFLGLEAGADDYISKPYDSKELQARLNVGRRIIKLQRELQGRVKELTGVYNLSRLIQEKEDLHQILQGTVDLIPDSLQYPGISCVRLLVGDRTYTTQKYEDTQWRLSRDIVVAKETIGTLDVCYLEERSQRDEGPFLKEEGYLITV
ncbi:MAG: response regulator transcription factor, partial [Desulfobacterales bacterium]